MATAQMHGKYVISDPQICHGKPTFRGTRIMVGPVLEQVAKGMPWQEIVRQWRGDVPVEAIEEAVRLARQAFLDHASEYTTGQLES